MKSLQSWRSVFRRYLHSSWKLAVVKPGSDRCLQEQSRKNPSEALLPSIKAPISDVAVVEPEPEMGPAEPSHSGEQPAIEAATKESPMAEYESLMTLVRKLMMPIGPEVEETLAQSPADEGYKMLIKEVEAQGHRQRRRRRQTPHPLIIPETEPHWNFQERHP